MFFGTQCIYFYNRLVLTFFLNFTSTNETAAPQSMLRVMHQSAVFDVTLLSFHVINDVSNEMLLMETLF